MTKLADKLPNFTAETPLLPAIAQDSATNSVLMLAYMNAEAFEETLRTGRAVYFSRSRQRLWRKGEESGHFQLVDQVLVDCDGDTILLKVRQQGVACHEGYESCFFREIDEDRRVKVVGERKVDPARVYKKK